MNASDIRKALTQIEFPTSSKFHVGFIEDVERTGAFEGTSQMAAVISMKNAWQLENRSPSRTFAPTDESVIDYVQSIADGAAQSAVKALVVIDMNKSTTSVWVVPKGMCFIATAAYGSPFAPEVVVFRQFRDEVLFSSKLGAAFVRLYYLVSPRVAIVISKSDVLRAIIRQIFLEPILSLIKK